MLFDQVETNVWEYYRSMAEAFFAHETGLPEADLLHFSPDNIEQFKKFSASLYNKVIGTEQAYRIGDYFNLYMGAQFLASTGTVAPTGSERDLALAFTIGQSLVIIKNGMLAMNDPDTAWLMAEGDRAAYKKLLSSAPIIECAQTLKQRLPEISGTTVMDFISAKSSIRPDLRQAMTTLLDTVFNNAPHQVLRPANDAGPR